MTKSNITAEHLYDLQVIQGCQISPNGKYIVFGLQSVDKETEKKHTNLYLVATDGSSEAQQITHGNHNDSNPRWSPDGSHIAFVSNRKDKKSQLYLLPITGIGEAYPITDFKGTIGSYQWSPDGKHIAFGFRAKDAEAIAREEDEKKKELGIVQRHITRVFYIMDGAGYNPKERWHIHQINVATKEVTALTIGDTYDEMYPTYSPDGKTLAYVSNAQPDPDLAPDLDELFLMDIATKTNLKITLPAGRKFLPSFSPDGKYIAYFGSAGVGEWWRETDLFLVPTSGATLACNLTAKYDMDADSITLNDVGGMPDLAPPQWSADSKVIYFQGGKHGSNKAYAIDIASGVLQAIINEKGINGPISLSADTKKIATIYGNMHDMGQVACKSIGSDLQILTKINQSFYESTQQSQVEEIWYKGAAGNDLQGWIMYPPNFDPCEKYPSILEIHGGPLLQYGETFMHEFNFLAANGYVVYFTNPRGGKGYGEDHAKAIWGAWGSADYDDLMAFTDYISQKEFIDTDRMGVTGGSYGGYMTNWIIGHTNRFKSAVTQRCVSNLTSMWGSSDFNWIFQQCFGNIRPFEDMERYWNMSPMKYMGNVQTPTLVIHSQNDYRCAIEQGQQVFVALKTQGIDTEFVIFPDEPHGLSRNGRTDRRILRLHHILRWMDKYLK